MANDRTVTHADGTTFSDGSGYVPTPELINNAWRLHGLAKAILELARGKRLTPEMNAALNGIVAEAERMP